MLRHRFERSGIFTRYRFSRVKAGSEVAIRLPVWGAGSELSIDRGALRRDGRWVRTTKPLAITATGADGGAYTASFTGIPRSAQLSTVLLRPDAYHPKGGRQLVISFRAPKGGMLFTRDLRIRPAS